jgi:hypothetical protein
MTPDDRSRVDKSHNIGVCRTTFNCNLYRIIQRNHTTTQWVGPLATDIRCLLHGHPTVELVAIPPTCPLVPHGGGKPRPTPEATRVKSDAAKLSDEGTLGPLKLNHLILVVQLIVLSEDICCRTAPTRSSSPDKFTNLDDRIRHQLMKLQSELTQDVHMN